MPAPEWLGVTLPVLSLAAGAAFIIMFECYRVDEGKFLLPARLIVAAVSIGCSIAFLFVLNPYHFMHQLPMGESYVFDRFSRWNIVLIVSIALIASVMAGISSNYPDRGNCGFNITMFLVLASISVMISTAGDLLTMGIELGGLILVILIVVFEETLTDGGKLAGAGAMFYLLWIISMLGVFFFYVLSGSSSLWQGAQVFREIFTLSSDKIWASGAFVAFIPLLLVVILPFALVELFPFNYYSRKLYWKMSLIRYSFIQILSKIVVFALLVRILWVLFLRDDQNLEGMIQPAVGLFLLALMTIISGFISLMRANTAKSLLFAHSVFQSGGMVLLISKFTQDVTFRTLIFLSVYSLLTVALMLFFSYFSDDRSDVALKGLFRKCNPASGAIAVCGAATFVCLAGFPFPIGHRLFISEFPPPVWFSSPLELLGSSARALFGVLSAIGYLRAGYLALLRGESADADSVNGVIKGKLSLSIYVVFSVLITGLFVFGFTKWKVILELSKTAIIIIENPY